MFCEKGGHVDIRVLLNGKKAGLEPVRLAIFKARETGNVEVRATWEAGDVLRLCNLNQSVQEVFEISGFSSILSVHGSKVEALDGF